MGCPHGYAICASNHPQTPGKIEGWYGRLDRLLQENYDLAALSKLRLDRPAKQRRKLLQRRKGHRSTQNGASYPSRYALSEGRDEG
jgi:hypothetical protein